ncbi:MAG: TetR/AcrR family transcriptional regulator [Chloroflexota bacterium]
MNRTVKPPEERRQEFIGTAQTLFYTKGYESTSVNDIIKAVGVSKGAFYHYFDSKQSVLEAVVDGIVHQSMAVIRQVVDDPNLAAIPKFNRMRQVVSGWKIERKRELLAVSKILFSDENIQLQQRLRSEGEKRFAPELAKIISQGVAEGVFETPYPQESARFLMAVMRTVSETFIQLLFEPERHPDPVAIAQIEFEAAQMAMERIISAPAGSLILIEMDTLAAWFQQEEKRKE